MFQKEIDLSQILFKPETFDEALESNFEEKEKKQQDNDYLKLDELKTSKLLDKNDWSMNIPKLVVFEDSDLN